MQVCACQRCQISKGYYSVTFPFRCIFCNSHFIQPSVRVFPFPPTNRLTKHPLNHLTFKYFLHSLSLLKQPRGSLDLLLLLQLGISLLANFRPKILSSGHTHTELTLAIPMTRRCNLHNLLLFIQLHFIVTSLCLVLCKALVNRFSQSTLSLSLSPLEFPPVHFTPCLELSISSVGASVLSRAQIVGPHGSATGLFFLPLSIRAVSGFRSLFLFMGVTSN